jgi:ubiquinone/menaquinone biosynthesis C-methylase UbiE
MKIKTNPRRASPTTAEFDLVAPFYPGLERLVFGTHLNDARQAFLLEILKANQVLLVGEGNGRFLKLLNTREFAGQVRVVEKSSMMIRLAKNHVGPLGKVDFEFVQGDFRRCQLGKGFDCVVTHFFLDLFNPPAQLAIIEKFAELTDEMATWINVDFIPARSWRGRVLMWWQYRFFRVVSRIEAKSCSDELPAALRSGWSLVEAVPYLGGLVVARRYQKATRNNNICE